MLPNRNKQPDPVRGPNGGQHDPLPPDDPKEPVPKPGEMQGEGNYEAARQFNAAERKFVESGRVEAAARAAAPRSEAEAQEMLDAERKGKSRAKDEDPALLKPAPRNTNRGVN